MKKLLSLFLLSFLCIIVSAGSSYAIPFYQVLSDNSIVSGTMDFSFDVDADTLTITVNNTTPTTTAAGITGFGFNMNPDLVSYLGDWSITAFEYDGVTQSFNEVILGQGYGFSTGPGSEWEMDHVLAGVTLNYLPHNGGNADGALYNPDVVSNAVGYGLLPGGQNDVFYTTATLILDFAGGGYDLVYSLPIVSDEFLRYQNAGNDGELSAKVSPVPEPATVLLVSTGLLCLAGFRKKFKK